MERPALRISRTKVLLLWLGIPLVLIAAAELLLRRLEEDSYARASWYEGVSEQLAAGEVDFLFVGTSRTASGLVPDAFESEMATAAGARPTAVNLGRAFSGPVAHYFGLRELVRRHPDAMRACTVSFETSAGLPSFTGTWEDPWYFEGNAQLVVDYMDGDDFRRFLRLEPRFESRCGVAARYLLRGSALVSGRRRLQQSIEWRGLRFTRSLLAAAGVQAPQHEGDLPMHRQLRDDVGGVRLQRDLVVERTSPEALAAQIPLAPWDAHVVCQTASFLRDHGVRVVFHDVPAPSYVWTVNDTPVRRADGAAFSRWADSLGLRRIDAGLHVGDEDFPDLSHLRAARIEEYSRKLARAFLSALPEGAERE